MPKKGAERPQKEPIHGIQSLKFSSQINMHSLGISISRQPGLAQLATNPTLLDTAKRNVKVRIIAAVDPHHASLEGARDAMRACQVGGEDGATEAIGGVIGAADGFGLGGEARDDDERAEDFFAGDAHGVCDVGEDGRGDEESFAPLHVLVRLSANG